MVWLRSVRGGFWQFGFRCVAVAAKGAPELQDDRCTRVPRTSVYGLVSCEQSEFEKVDCSASVDDGKLDSRDFGRPTHSDEFLMERT